MMGSYNYQFRYFLTILPILAVFSGFFMEWLYTRAAQGSTSLFSRLVVAGVVLIVVFSFARLASVALLFMNDSRAPAGDYIRTLPAGTSLEHTYYPPTIPEEHFASEFNYPIYFVKGNEPLPTSKQYKYNVGEVGLDDRETDYLVVDSFTSDKFNDPYTCANMQVECDFFKQLSTGHSDHYQLLKEFTFTLPPYLPQINFLFINPTIRIYERIK
jgi:hypothetical protein